MSLFDDPDDVDESLKGKQEPIVTTDDYPMRVLAGAGTGKTFTMVRKVERLLETDQASPHDILALTFTNKAADSMRTKLNARIGADGYDIDAYTYHSICHSILQEYPYYAGLPSGFSIADDADKFELAQAAVEDIPYQFVNPDGSYRRAPEEVLLEFISSMKQEGVSPAELAAYLPSSDVLIELEELTVRIETEARDHLRRQSLGEDSVDGFCEDLETFKEQLQLEQQTLGSSPVEADVTAYLQQLIQTVEQCQTRVRQDATALDTGSKQAGVRIPAVLFSGYGTHGEQMTRKSDFPSGIPKLPFTPLDRLRAYLAECKRAADLHHGYRSYEDQRQAAELVDFDDLVQKTVDLLADESIAAEIADQWEYIFCDEFQDTDSIQFELVTALAEHNQLFVVGDDDQAIYEWRGAESENIGQRLTETYQPDLVDKELELNFRSKQPILDLVNNAIKAVEGRGSDKELTAFGDNQDATDGVAYIDTTVPDEAEATDDDAYQATQIATTVAGLLRGDLESVDQSYELDDIALLVRKNRHARPLIDAFGDMGIPFELTGDLSTESIGVETVVAYLRALASPADDVSVRRVLLMRYRLNEADLRQIASAGDRLIDGLRSVDPSTVSEPDRLKTARSHFEQLLSRRDTLSVQQLYHELLTTTEIEWFLTRTERHELQGLEELVNNFGERSSQPPLDDRFIDYLDRQGDIADAVDSGPGEQADRASDAVSIMTVHQAKGLDFPVVILPNLTADEWSPTARDYAELVDAVDDVGFWEADQVNQDLQEARRLLHVGITRAEDQLILCGQSDGQNETNDGITKEYIQSWLGTGIEWDLTATTFPIWDDIQESLPPSAQEWTSMVSQDTPQRAETVATYAGDELGYDAAIETALGRAQDLLERDLSAVEPASLDITSDAFAALPDPSLSRRHSYTALGTVEECARQHYLEHVVYAYDRPDTVRVSGDTGDRSSETETESTTATDYSASNREIGVLFHETAEAAIDRGHMTRAAWRDVCEHIATTQGLEHALDGALDCVDRFFETPVSDWELLSAEHSFEITIDGSRVVGEIDCLARRPDGELVVLDYKATGAKKTDTNRQLPLYILACEELFDETVTTAGYVYVSEIGPEVDIRTYDEERLTTATEQIREGLRAAASSSYAEYTAGEHCKWCPHNDLPCSDGSAVTRSQANTDE